jgi:hypothetical protein
MAANIAVHIDDVFAIDDITNDEAAHLVVSGYHLKQ